MKKYLLANPDIENRDFISCIDELPLWSAPFGLSLLDRIEMKTGLNVLDIGCGTGFPLIELAQRLGNTCRLTGIDPWGKVLDRVRLKIVHAEITNVEVFNYPAEAMPFSDGYFNLIVSNNGLNNVRDIEQSLRECNRVADHGAQLLLTQNLEGTMIEFYTLFEKVLSEKQMFTEIFAMKDHIWQKRRPVHEIIEMIEKNDFNINQVEENCFYLRFLDANAMFNHSLIRFWFADSWKKIIPEELHEEVFTALEHKLNLEASEKGDIKLSVPYVVIDSRKK